LNGSAPPSRNDEYFFYQILIGSWPAELSRNGAATVANNGVLEEYRHRVQNAMRKAIREERVSSNWMSPNEGYEAAVESFISDALDPVRSEAFLTVFRAFEKRVAEYGVHNSLVQLVLKLTLPGVPDLYQGSEGWDLSLGDPDSRRPVDYTQRAEQLRRVRERLQNDRACAMRELLKDWRDGSIKMALAALLLDERKSNPKLFSDSTYEVLTSTGPYAAQVCAFARKREGAAIITAAKLFTASNTGATDSWQRTLLAVPGLADVRDILTNREFEASNENYSLAQLFEVLPVAVLIPRT
jgi:(1->4)-alpha-D-glucan 1-alpha-D-glucosylmutase